MNPESHGRARRLIDAWHVEGISISEQAWLDSHLAECPACQAQARASERALQTLRQNTMRINPALVSTTQARVRLRTRELRENQARLRALWISCGLSWLLGALTAPLLWQALGWVGRSFELSPAVRITVFGVCWIFPATVVGAFVAWRYSRFPDVENHRGAWER
jgi:anti-sigma factor RsiW